MPDDFLAIMDPPERIEIIGNTLALHWQDRSEDFWEAPFLRKHSPSAENIGEKDIFGNHYGNQGKREYPRTELTAFQRVGNYAIRLVFKDGHQSGLYSWEYLRSLRKQS